ncbi:MAG: CinA family nicotinamide mononucleotide deamidase-related protein [Verrucomicrobia bacterium]|nr:CinA family nicotinamide mononucleotide deamidase-related protein [Verrucomicrobiota bacterium]
MRVVVLNTGTELLLGDVINTHLAFIAQQILALGLRVSEQRTVPDGDAIQNALRDLFPRADILFVTGGLGATSDDLTIELTAACLELELREESEVREAIRKRLSARGVQMPESIWRQALVPAGGEVLPNKSGTAPGIYLPANINRRIASPHMFILPGPPRELQPMFHEFVMPILQRVASASGDVIVRRFRVARMGESVIEEKIGGELAGIGRLEIGYCARPAEVDVRVVGSPKAVARASEIIRAKLGCAIFSSNEEQLAEVIVRLLAERGETLALAESCTGGLLAHKITNVPGASQAFRGAFVTYSNEEKICALSVSPEALRQSGAVSERVAVEMTSGARERTGATHAIATTGIAGPGGGTTEKPVGTVFVAIASLNGETSCEKLFFPGERETFKELVAQHAFDLLRLRL